ncbi:MAG: DUF896 domain-containing protein [Oscillospiraceae bacterium]
MIQQKIDRINELSRKSRTEVGLTDGEKLEQATLRQEYRDGFKKNLTGQLDNTIIVEPDGSKHKIVPKN